MTYEKKGKGNQPMVKVVKRKYLLLALVGIGILAVVVVIGYFIWPVVLTITPVYLPIELSNVRVLHNQTICEAAFKCSIPTDGGVGIPVYYKAFVVPSLPGHQPDTDSTYIEPTYNNSSRDDSSNDIVQKLSSSLVREAFAIEEPECNPPSGTNLAPGGTITCTWLGITRTVTPFYRNDTSGCASLLTEKMTKCEFGLPWWVEANSFVPLRIEWISTNVVDVESAGLSVYFDNGDVKFYDSGEGPDDADAIDDAWDLLDPDNPVSKEFLEVAEVSCDDYEIEVGTNINCNEGSVMLTYDLENYDNNLTLEYVFSGDGSFKQKFSFTQSGGEFKARETLTLPNVAEFSAGDVTISPGDNIASKIGLINTAQHYSFRFGSIDNIRMHQNLAQILDLGEYRIDTMTWSDSTLTFVNKFGLDDFAPYPGTIDLDPQQSASTPTQYKYIETNGAITDSADPLYVGKITDGGATNCASGTDCAYRGGFQWSLVGVNLPNAGNYHSQHLKIELHTIGVFGGSSLWKLTIKEKTTSLSDATFGNLDDGANYNLDWTINTNTNYLKQLGGSAVTHFECHKGRGSCTSHPNDNLFAVAFMGQEGSANAEQYVGVDTPAGPASYKGKLLYIYTCNVGKTGVLCDPP